jgi:predicted transcriptional regulator
MREERSSEVVRITRVQNRVNVPSDRFRRHLREMEKLGLVNFRNTLSITIKGREFVSEYRRFSEFMNRFGLV